METLANSVALRTFDAALEGLVQHPKMAPFFDQNAGNVPPERVQQLRHAREYVFNREQALKAANAAYRALGEKRAAQEKGPAKVTYLDEFSADDALCGAGPSGYLVRTAPVTPFISPDSGKLGWIEGLEGLEWRAPDGEKRAIWSGYNVYGYPAAAPEGKPVVLVEDLFGLAKTVTVIGEGAPKRIKIDPAHRFSAPAVAPGGAAVALEDRPCPSGCAGDLVVLSTADGKELFRAGPEGGNFDGHAWLDAKRLVFLHSPAGTKPVDEEDEDEGDDAAKAPAPAAAGPKTFDRPRQTLWLVDLSAADAKPQALLTVGEGEGLYWLRASGDGKRLAAAYRGPKFRGLATVDLQAANGATLNPIDVGGAATAPSFSPDGKRIAFDLVPVGSDGDEEIAVIPIEGGKVTRLTDNPFRDRYPTWSADGSHIFFESLDRDPSFPRNRNVSVVASVPAAP
jgi:hypothetical protein